MLSRTIAGWVFAPDGTAWWVAQSVLFGVLLLAVQYLALPDGLYKPESLGRPAPTSVLNSVAAERGARRPPADG
ncbi:hypothetical protein [Patulibacter americanus]|uniref:hypothetical protein n=1 Tax=Patulibacter americanus TaxID=588672 RepID=UPI0003B575B4|nr:hypothetical protein [Patulibacter americanus]